MCINHNCEHAYVRSTHKFALNMWLHVTQEKNGYLGFVFNYLTRFCDYSIDTIIHGLKLKNEWAYFSTYCIGNRAIEEFQHTITEIETKY